MVYESDFYTTRRPYRATPSLSTYTVTRREVPWEKVPFVPRPSLVPDPVTAFGKRKVAPRAGVDKVTLTPLERASIKPKVRLEPLRPYMSARDETREKTEPSRQVRILPGLGKVHVVHSYDRIVPYVGHKRLTVVTPPPVVVRLRPSTLYREFDRIEHKYRPYTYHSYTNDYLNSDSHVRIIYNRYPISSSYPVYSSSTLSTNRYYPTYYPFYPYYYDYPTTRTRTTISRLSYPSYLSSYWDTYYAPSTFYSWYSPTRRFYSSYSLYPSDKWLDLSLYPTWRNTHYARMFDDETRLIRAQTNALLNQVHSHVPRRLKALPIPYTTSPYEVAPPRYYNDNYIHKMLVSSPSGHSDYTTYWTDPVKKSFCQGRLACVNIVGGKGHPRRKNVYVYHDDPVRSDIQLLSYYINRFREEKKTAKPTRVPRQLEDPKDNEEMKQLREERAARMAKIIELTPEAVGKVDKKSKMAEEKAKEEARIAAEEVKKAAEEKKRKQKQEEEAAKKAAEEAERKEREAKEAAEKAAELERLAELARQEELAKQAEIEKKKKEEEERAKAEEEKRLAEAAKAEEERLALLRLEEIARQAEEEKEAELARQAEELAELARQEAELAEAAKAEEEAAERARQEAEAAELAQKEAELAALEEKEKELTEAAEQARIEADEMQHNLENPQEEAAAPEQDEEVAVESQEVEQTEEAEPIVEEPESPVIEDGNVEEKPEETSATQEQDEEIVPEEVASVEDGPTTEEE